jgi:hypothetical protein
MADRHFPVRPNLDQLKHQAKDLLRGIKRGDADAIGELRARHPEAVAPAAAKLADAQLVLARSYGLPSWPRLVLACRMTEAIWRDDVSAVRALVLKHPPLLHQMARGTERCNWGPPMTYAANLGRDRMIAMLRDLGAKDIRSAHGRAVLQGQIGTARRLYVMGGGGVPPQGAVMGPAETQNGAGMAYLLELGAEICDSNGDPLAPVAMVLSTYCRNPPGKHECLELFAAHGIQLPDTPTMAIHRGRTDLLEQHLKRDKTLLSRTFSYDEIYPKECGGGIGLHATPLGGTTLLHLCIDYDEVEMVRWLLTHGADVNAKADVDADGFGGHTALFGCVVRQSSIHDSDVLAKLLLDRGADPNVRASLRKQLVGTSDQTMHLYRDVTPLSWGQRFHDRDFVSQAAMRLIAERGGHT